MRLLHMGLMAGLTEEQAWMTNPGRIADLYLWKRDYDDEQHGIKRIKGDV